MPRRDTDGELGAHFEVVAHIRDESGYADAVETYANCWKLREWRDRLQANTGDPYTMSDFARYVWDSIEAGTWDADWNGILFRLMRRNMPPTLRRRLLDGMPKFQAAHKICSGSGSSWFTPQELRAWKPQLVGVYMRHPGRHFIDEIPDG